VVRDRRPGREFNPESGLYFPNAITPHRSWVMIGRGVLHCVRQMRGLTRRLCDELGLDPILERERVHGRFFGRQRDVRVAYLEADPARAAAEIAILEAPDPDGVPYESRTEVELRLRSSFFLDECEQVERWGYNPIRHELLDRPR